MEIQVGDAIPLPTVDLEELTMADGFDDGGYSDDEFSNLMTDTDVRSAGYLVESFLDGRPDELGAEPGLPVSDIEADAGEFEADLALLERMGADVPTSTVGGGPDVPIALRAAVRVDRVFDDAAKPWLLPGDRRFNETTSRLFETAIADGDLAEYPTITSDEARSTFFQLAQRSLARRIAFFRSLADGMLLGWPGSVTIDTPQRAGGSDVATPGCVVEVSTDSRGLRVLSSGAYYIAPTYFGSPTSPAKGALVAGTYCFGVDGRQYGSKIRWDHNAVIELPGQTKIHLNL